MRTRGYSRVTSEDDAVARESEEEWKIEDGTAGSLGTLWPLLSFPSTLRLLQDPTLASRLLFSWARPIIDASPTDMDKLMADELTMA
eukprot:SAG31_NODE_29540_length_393_cov_1.380952_1_plen_86_part_10